jgi:hypothetical protein
MNFREFCTSEVRKVPIPRTRANRAEEALGLKPPNDYREGMIRGVGVPPASAGRVGLRHWTVVLEDREEVAAVSERIREAGITTEEHEGGLLVRDPWGIA